MYESIRRISNCMIACPFWTYRSNRSFHRLHSLLLLTVFLLLGCSKSEEVLTIELQIAERETRTTFPTDTPSLTATATHTNTPQQTTSPTFTPTPSHTSTRTLTPTFTPTNTPSPTPSPTRLGGGTGRIIFEAEGGLDVINADGTDRIRLITNSGFSTKLNNMGCVSQFDSVWSPDGTMLLYITFTSNEQGFDIGISNADGSGQSLVAATIGADDNWPSWSPDGSHILFTSSIRGGQRSTTIYTVKKDGSALEALTTEGFVSTWSPDGQHIAFNSGQSGRSQIFIINTDGSERRLLTDAVYSSEAPVWFPNGQRLAFFGSYEGGLAIYVSEVGGETQRVSESIAPVSPNYIFRYRSLAISPDGQRILFTSPMDDSWNIYVMNRDGSDLTQLTDDPLDDTGPHWSPDGRMITFERTIGNRFVPGGVQSETDVFVMNADGLGEINLTPDSGLWDSCPSWQPLIETVLESRSSSN